MLFWRKESVRDHIAEYQNKEISKETTEPGEESANKISTNRYQTKSVINKIVINNTDYHHKNWQQNKTNGKPDNCKPSHGNQHPTKECGSVVWMDIHSMNADGQRGKPAISVVSLDTSQKCVPKRLTSTI